MPPCGAEPSPRTPAGSPSAAHRVVALNVASVDSSEHILMRKASQSRRHLSRALTDK